VAISKNVRKLLKEAANFVGQKKIQEKSSNFENSSIGNFENRPSLE
jgi:hypothetical protein